VNSKSCILKGYLVIVFVNKTTLVLALTYQLLGPSQIWCNLAQLSPKNTPPAFLSETQKQSRLWRVCIDDTHFDPHTYQGNKDSVKMALAGSYWIGGALRLYCYIPVVCEAALGVDSAYTLMPKLHKQSCYYLLTTYWTVQVDISATYKCFAIASSMPLLACFMPVKCRRGVCVATLQQRSWWYSQNLHRPLLSSQT